MFARKRAQVACDFCRYKKRRCDGVKPICTNCQASSANCVYQELPPQRIDHRQVYDRLDAIEQILVQHTEQIQHHSSMLDQIPTTGNGNLPALTIPVHHQTSTMRLLNLGPVQSLLGEVYSPDYFFNIESSRACPSATVEPDLSATATTTLLSDYLGIVHPHHPVIDADELWNLHSRFLQGDLSSDGSVVVYAACALGCIASSSIEGAKAAAGIEYLLKATSLAGENLFWDFGNSSRLAQGLVLISLYFAYLAYPLHSWKYIHAAASIVEMQLYRKSTNFANKLFWSCFLIQCDRFAEFELPRSGIETLVDDIDLPECNNEADAYFLAEISIRRLLNRVHSILYSSSPPQIESILSMCSELNRQLELWYDSIPKIAKPMLDPAVPADNERAAILRIRFYAARHIIYRPFVLKMVENPELTEFVDHAKKCLHSCRCYIQSTTQVLSRPSPYTWTISQSSLGAVLVLTLAARSEALSEFVPDITELQELAITNIDRWSKHDSSISNAVAMLSCLKDRVLAD